jgi:hypothetical protein
VLYVICKKKIAFYRGFFSALTLGLLSTAIIIFYFSQWVIAFNVTCVFIGLIITTLYLKQPICDLCTALKKPDSMEKVNECIDILHQLINKIDSILLESRFLYFYPLSIFSAYLLVTQLAAQQNICTIALSSLFILSILIEVGSVIFSKGCEVYVEKYRRDLPTEDPRNKVAKATDLLKWYDLRWLFMPFVMPVVEIYFKELTDALGERNFDVVNTDMYDMHDIQALQCGPSK